MEKLEKDMKPRFIEDLGIRRKEGKVGAYRYGLFECQYCGNSWEVITTQVNMGHTRSCGCVNLRITHGLTQHRFYKTWNNMTKRCNNPKNSSYINYGGVELQFAKSG